MLRLSQWGIVGFELLSPIVMFVAAKRLKYGIVAFFYLFHLTVFLAVEISFLPHMVAMACFLPLERIQPRDLIRTAPRLPGLIRRKLQARKAVPVPSKPDEPVREAEPAS
jgi:hypothetical protein